MIKKTYKFLGITIFEIITSENDETPVRSMLERALGQPKGSVLSYTPAEEQKDKDDESSAKDDKGLNQEDGKNAQKGGQDDNSSKNKNDDKNYDDKKVDKDKN